MKKTSTVVIVGRPNVGKSTLFNKLIGKREALVDNLPGVTRDRLYGRSEWLGRTFAVIDTGGFDPCRAEGIWKEMKGQVMLAIEEADAIIFLLDGAEGVTPVDEDISDYLRRHARVPVFHAVNKIDHPKREGMVHQFWSLGADKLYPVSAEHSLGIDDLLDDLIEILPPEEELGEMPDAIPVAVVGKPNVGKSTLINKLLGAERLLTHDSPGTTRDTVDTVVSRGEGGLYRFIDTAGIRKKSKVTLRIEKFSIIKALKAIDRCHVALIMIDASQGPTDQDAKVAGYALDSGKAAIILLNKWDLVGKDTHTFDQLVKKVRERLYHLDYAPVLSVSAKTGLRLHRLFEQIDKVDAQHSRRVGTSELNKVLEEAVARHKPSVAGGKRIKFYYATQYGVRPPRFAIFTNRPDDIRVSYQRYLANRIREAFGFEGTPLRLKFRQRGGERKK